MSTTVVHPEKSVATATFVSRVKPPEPFTLVLFGATGDLAGRKLLPALSSLMDSEYLPADFAIVGIGRRDKTDDSFRDDTRKDLAEFRKNVPADDVKKFLKHVYYQRTDFTTAEGMHALAK